MTVELGLFALYLVAIIAITLYTARGGDREDYMLGGRDLSAFAIFASIIACWTSGGMLSSIAALAYSDVAFMFFLMCGALIGFAIMGLLAGRMRLRSRERSIYTMPGMGAAAFGRPSVMLTALITSTAYLIFLIMELTVGGALLSSASMLSYRSGVILIALLVAAYLMIGGFSVIIRTDIIQFMMIVLIAIGFAVLGDYSAVKKDTLAMMSDDVIATSWHKALGDIILFIPGVIATADLWQRIYAARSDGHARSSMFALGIGFFVLFIPMTLLALNVAQLEQGLRDSMIFIKAMELFLPSWFYPLGILAVLAIIMSTLDSFSFVTGQSLMNDGIMRLFPEFTGRRPRLFSRIGVLLIFLIAVPISLIRPELTTLMYLAIYLFTCMMPIFYALMKSPPGGTGVFIAMLAALIANVGLFYAGLLTSWISIGIMAVAMVYPFLHDRLMRMIHTPKSTSP